VGQRARLCHADGRPAWVGPARPRPLRLAALPARTGAPSGPRPPHASVRRRRAASTGQASGMQTRTAALGWRPARPAVVWPSRTCASTSAPNHSAVASAALPPSDRDQVRARSRGPPHARSAARRGPLRRCAAGGRRAPPPSSTMTAPTTAARRARGLADRGGRARDRVIRAWDALPPSDRDQVRARSRGSPHDRPAARRGPLHRCAASGCRAPPALFHSNGTSDCVHVAREVWRTAAAGPETASNALPPSDRFQVRARSRGPPHDRPAARRGPLRSGAASGRRAPPPSSTVTAPTTACMSRARSGGPRRPGRRPRHMRVGCLSHARQAGGRGPLALCCKSACFTPLSQWASRPLHRRVARARPRPLRELPGRAL
jgi:hypothetical protein